MLLLGNGVFCAVAATFARLRAGKARLTWYALSDDVIARGIGHHLSASVKLIDDGAFVDLVAAHQPIVSWS